MLSKTVAILVGTTLSSALPSSFAIQCNETDALLKVSFAIDQDSWENLYPQNSSSLLSSPELVLRPSGNIGNSTYEFQVDYGSFEDVVDFENCIPREGACVELTLSVFPADSYSISWNGDAVKVGRDLIKEKYPITSTEIGDFCTPLCDESTEALFEYDYWTSGFPELYEYRVEDQSGNIVLGYEGPDDFWGVYYSVYIYKSCLPKDTCYLFLLASDRHRIPEHTARYSEYDFYPSFLVKYDGKVVTESDSWQFISAVFGSNCLPDCNLDDESFVEFFMYRQNSMNCEPMPDLDCIWDLRVENTDGSSAVASSGVVPFCRDTRISREILCVPKATCASFHIECGENYDLLDVRECSLSMDGVSYRGTEGTENRGTFNRGLNQTTNIGNCTVSALCDPSNQAIFEVEFHTPTEYTSEDGVRRSVIPYSSIDWIFAKNDNFISVTTSDNAYHSSYYNDAAYKLGTVYRTIECVDDDECKYVFTMMSISLVEKYTVKRNGGDLSRIIDHSPQYSSTYGHPGPADVTLFGENCQSGGPIAGIVMTRVVVAVGIIGSLLSGERSMKAHPYCEVI